MLREKWPVADKLKTLRQTTCANRFLDAAHTPLRANKGRLEPVDQQTRQALKHDQFVDTTAHGLEWASENRRSLLVTSGIVLALIVAVVAATLVYNHRADQAAVAFGDAMQAYQTPIAPVGQPVPPGTKTFPSSAERAKAANQLFTQVADRFGMTPSGKLARYFAGLTYLDEGQNASAENTLKSVSGSWDRDLSSLAKLALAQLYRQTGRTQQAIDLYNELAAKPSSTVPAGTAQLQLAELYENQNQPEQAKKIYAQLKDKDAKGPAGAIAAQKLNPSPVAGPAF
jgi:predicted negative regulator of RcsB-dependent stress response